MYICTKRNKISTMLESYTNDCLRLENLLTQTLIEHERSRTNAFLHFNVDFCPYWDKVRWFMIRFDIQIYYYYYYYLYFRPTVSRYCRITLNLFSDNCASIRARFEN